MEISGYEIFLNEAEFLDSYRSAWWPSKVPVHKPRSYPCIAQYHEDSDTGPCYSFYDLEKVNEMLDALNKAALRGQE
jgi:hypothetical protein